MKPHKAYREAYAIVRVDEFQGQDTPADQKVTVKMIVWDAGKAAQEVERLNRLQKGEGVRYFFQPTRVERPLLKVTVSDIRLVHFTAAELMETQVADVEVAQGPQWTSSRSRLNRSLADVNCVVE